MTPLALFGTVALTHLLAVMSPGPDFAVVLRQTLAQGRRAGVITAAGIASGIVVHVGWALFGLGWVVERYPLLLEILRYAGAAFLLWIGLRSVRTGLRAAGSAGPAAPAPTAAGAASFAIGLGTNLLNAKAMLFFVALCSAVITQDTPAALRIALGLWMVFSTFAWFALLSVGLGHPALRTRLQRAAPRIDMAVGALLVLLALAMLVAG